MLCESECEPQHSNFGAVYTTLSISNTVPLNMILSTTLLQVLAYVYYTCLLSRQYYHDYVY